MISNCNETNTNRIIPVTENKSTFRIINRSLLTVNKVIVDKCLQKDPSKRCDYLFEIIHSSNVDTVYYVELKGRDVEHGIKQLTSTIKYCNNIHNNIKKESYIVLSHSKLNATKLQILKSEFKKKNKSLLVVKNVIIEVNI